MQLEPSNEKELPPGEQIAATALDLQLAADVLAGMTVSELLPPVALRLIRSLQESLEVNSGTLRRVHATLAAKPPRPAPAAPPPARAPKKPARAHTRAAEAPAPAKPPRSNGTAHAPPAAPEPTAKPAP